MKHLISAVVLALATQIGSADAQDCKSQVKTINPGELIVASYDYPPFAESNPDGSVSGIDYDVVAAAAAGNCLKIVPMVVEGAAAVQSVVSGKADVAIGGWDRTTSRDKVVGMSAPIYMDPSAIISKQGIDTIGGLEGKTVGTVSGYLFVPALQALLGSNLKLYPDSVALAQDLAAGRVDAGMDGYASAVYSQKLSGAYKGMQIKIPTADERVPSTRRPEQAGILYTKGNDSLGSVLDAAIERRKKEGKLSASLVAAGFDASLANTGEPYLVDE